MVSDFHSAACPYSEIAPGLELTAPKGSSESKQLILIGPTFKQYTPEIQHRTTNLFIKAPSIFSGSRYSRVCPTAEDSGVLMSSVFVVFKCVGGRGEKEGTGDWVRGLKMGS
jgi:hypothetical protein